MNGTETIWLTTREAAARVRISTKTFLRKRAELGIEVSLRLGRQNPRYDAAQIDAAMRDPQHTLRGRAPKLQVVLNGRAA